MQIQTLNISLPKELVKKTDTAARKSFKSRSEYIKDAVVAQLKEEGEWEEIFAEGQKIGKRMRIKSEEDINKIIKEYRREKRAQNNSRY